MVKVSIIIPCYNQAEYLDEGLQSVLDQTYTNWECIIINDGSVDNTEEIAKDWILKDNRFKYTYKENGGLSSARNAGITIANGEFILPLDADDKISKDYIRLGILELEKESNIKIVYCKARKFGLNVEDWLLPEYKISHLAYNNMIHASAIFRKEDWLKVKGYDKKMIYGFEDWEFWIAILKNGGEVICLDYLGFHYRIKVNSMIKNMDQEKKNKMFNYMSIKHADFFVEHVGSFFYLRNEIAVIDNNYKAKLKSEKFVIDLFLYKFFNFTIFGKYKP